MYVADRYCYFFLIIWLIIINFPTLSTYVLNPSAVICIYITKSLSMYNAYVKSILSFYIVKVINSIIIIHTFSEVLKSEVRI